MGKKNIFKINFLIIFLGLCLGVTNLEAQNCNTGTPSTTPPTGISVFIGDDVEFSNSNSRGTPTMASRVALDAQDDNWRTSANTNGLTSFNTPWTGGSGTTTANTASTPLNLFTHNNVDVTAALHNIPLGVADCDGTINANQGNLDNNDSLQDDAPRPEQFYVSGNQPRFWNENAGQTGNQNALVFDFSIPVKAFGAWFGDVETRSDGMASPALLRLVDSMGNRIGDDIIITPNGTSDQSICGGGGASTSPSACGNETTRWIGFVDSNLTPRISQAVIIVGDDDLGGDGFTEHLSFIGATIATLAPTSANVSIQGRVVTESNTGVFRTIVTITDTSSMQTKTLSTNPFGYFKFSDLEVGNFYIITVKHKRYQFENDTQSLQVFENVSGLTFVTRNIERVFVKNPKE